MFAHNLPESPTGQCAGIHSGGGQRSCQDLYDLYRRAKPTSLANFEVSLCTRHRPAPDWAQQMLRIAVAGSWIPSNRELCPSCPAGFFNLLVYSPSYTLLAVQLALVQQKRSPPFARKFEIKKGDGVTTHMTPFTFLWGQGGR